MSAKMNPSNSTAKCDCPDRISHHSILYSLLSSGTTATTPQSSAQSSSTSASMATMAESECKEAREGEMSSDDQVAIYPWDRAHRSPRPMHTLPTVVKLKNPDEMCPCAAQLLLKTVDFIRSLPSVLCLSCGDRVRLLQHCWSELLVLTMAQHRVNIQVERVSLHREKPMEGDALSSTSESVDKSVVTPAPVAKSCPESDCREGALLKYIIATQGIPTAADIDTLNAFFQKCQTLDIDDKEFAYLKSTIFFNPDVRGLCSAGLVETLQGHTQLKLSEYVTALHPRDPLRFAHLLLGLPPLRNVRPRVVTQLFFRELIGDVVEMEEILQQMLVNTQ
ncbi:nuclear receptor subfamily 0 group B member 1-like isoform X1 [Diadema antillarum]|uniref:nuclear receptor subfamily 0 group B member 1-like isoform X1 n=1 Tax=Diadema antillarum TaxID=105358 RepID=UPI003A85E7E2